MKLAFATAFLSLVIASSTYADVTYTITLTDEQDEAVQEQARLINLEVGKRFKGPTQTPADLITNTVRGVIRTWEAGHAEESTRKDWSTRTPREKRISCRHMKIAAGACPP